MASMTPDPWQAALLQSTAAQIMLLCSRQTGKSTAASALALLTAILNPPALILLLSPSQRQSAELFRAKVLPMLADIRPVVAVARKTALTLELANGSRIVSLPENEETIRGFSDVALLVIDEASRVSDALYMAVRPMLAVSHGRLIALSTPFGKQGWYHEQWTAATDSWERIRITAGQCPRITPDFLAEERRGMGARWYRQEYECDFVSVLDAVFRDEDIQAAIDPNVKPLFLPQLQGDRQEVAP